jgi:hypothetical protein
MPTGYTRKLIEEGEKPKDFVLKCLRAMSVCSSMRDDPLDDKIPAKFKIDNYHLKEISRAKKELNKLKKFSEVQKLNYSKTKKEEVITSHSEMYECAKDQQLRLDQMREIINAWEVSEEYQSFKNFILAQIKISSVGLEYYEARLSDVHKTDSLFFYNEAITSLNEDISYHTKQHKKEIELTKNKNAYLKGIFKYINKLK